MEGNASMSQYSNLGNQGEYGNRSEKPNNGEFGSEQDDNNRERGNIGK